MWAFILKIPFIKQIAMGLGAIALGLTLWNIAVYTGKLKERKACEVADLKAELAEKDRQIQATAALLGMEREARKLDEAEHEADKEKARAYEELLKKGDDVPLTDGIADRLSALKR